MSKVRTGHEGTSKGENTTLPLLREQAAIYAKLESLSTKQHALVSDDNSSPLLALLADRQRLTVDLQRVASLLASARRNWPATRDALSPAEQTEADGLLTAARERMRRVMEADERDARVLSAKRAAVAGSLRQTQTVGQAVSAYRAPSLPRDMATRLDEAS